MKHYDELLKCLQYQNEHPPKDPSFDIGWSWSDVGIPSHILRNLFGRGLLEVVYHSAHHTQYKVTEKGRLVVSGAQENDEPSSTLNNVVVPPDDMFADIIGYDKLKELLREVLTLEKPIHVLLHGPPALSKTLFLWEVERYGGDNALWIVGSASSKSGIWDTLAEKRPRWLLVDELEKMGANEQAGLLSIMEGGRLVRTKTARHLDLRLNICVLASANKVSKLSPELLSRFARYELTLYSEEEYRTVVQGVLVRHEGLNAEQATEIATALSTRTQDVRDAIRVARLATKIGVKKAIELLCV